MSDRPSDAELIRICLEGTASDLTDSVLAEIRDRFETSALLQAAVSESPLSKVITKQLGVSADAVTAGTSRRQTTGSRRLKLLSGAVVCGLLTGLAMWINGQGDGEVDPLPLGPVAETETGDVAPVPASTAGDAQPSSGEATKPHNGKPTETTDTAKAPAHRSPDEMEPESASRTTVAAVPLSPAGSPDDQPPIWAESLSLEVPPRTFENVAWVLPGQEKADQFTPADCRRWLSPVPGKPFQMGELKVDTRVFTSFNGIATLRAPWVDAAVLRLGMYDAERCTITIWQGNRGVQLRYYRSRNPNLWGVYSVSRNGPEGEDALPRVGHLMITDSGRWHRTNLGTFDLRWSDGFLRMVRGNVVLLTVPFEARPEEVVLDGKMNLRELRMFRSDPLPDYVVDRAKSAAGPNSLPSVKPAELEWSTAEVPDRAFSKNTADGTVRLVTTSTSEKLSRAWSSIPAAGLSEMIFRISSADPGTGVYFGGADGEPIFQVATVWDTAASRPAIWFRLAAQHELETRFDSGGQAAPWTGRDQWLRVVAGYGMTTIEISPDGIHWGWLTDTPIRTDWEQLATIGVYTEPKGDRQIQLSQISVNEFSTLPAVADPTLIARVDIAGFEPLKLLDMGSWLHRVIRFQPSGVAFDAWRRACAVATLRARPRAELGTFLLNGLLTDGAFSDEALKDSDDDQAWNLLNEVSQLVSVVDSNRTVQFQQLYHERARRRVISDFEHHRRNDDQTGTERAVSLSDIRNMTSAFLSSPLWSSQPSAMTPQDATRLELIALVQEGRLAAVRTLVDQVVFWNAHSHPQRDWWSQVDPLYPTVAWAELRSHETLDSEAQSERLSLPRRWKTGLIPERHPLAQPVSKEAYNVMAEFQAAVSGAAFQDACQVISSAGSADLIGLLPDSLDDQLLVSFPNAVALAMDQYPELRHQMNERFGAIGRLRVRQAIENGDYRQVESATVQFFGTPAAAESDLWLGDRAIAAGRFAQARGYYERAMKGFRKNSQVETAEITSLEARIEIVAALLGETTEPAPVASSVRTVSIGSRDLDQNEIRNLVVELSAARAHPGTTSASVSHISRASTATFQSVRIPLPVTHQLEKRARYEGDLGEHVGRSAPPDTDWVSRQLGSTIDGDRVFLCNRFQLSCVDLTNGSTKWNQQLGGDHGSAHHWPMLALQPLVTGASVYCRRLTKTGVELICCKADTGEVRWRKQIPQAFVSDPFLLRGRLQILSTDQSSVGPTVLNLHAVHPETGDIVSTVPLLKLFDAWQNNMVVCQVAVQDGLMFVSTVGAIACCNSEGQTLWVRRREWTPTTLDSRYRYARSWSPPVLVEKQLIVGQPESPVIDCLDPESGRLIWQHIEPELRRIIAHHDGTLLIETREGLKSLSIETGRTQWLYPAADLLDGIAIGPLGSAVAATTAVAKPATTETAETIVEQYILATRLLPLIDGRLTTAVPTLVWIHAGTGHEIARQPLMIIADKEARIGPLLISKDRCWAFAGKGRTDGTRDIVELVPTADSPLPAPVDQKVMAAWHPEFLVSVFPDNLRAQPDLVSLSLQRDTRNGVDALCPGWMLIGTAQPAGMGQRPEHRGQKEVLELKLPAMVIPPEVRQALAQAPINSIRLLRDLYVPATGDTSFRFRAGQNSGQSWNLTITANGEQIHSTVIDDQTAPTGWSSIHTSLERWTGQRVRILLTCSLSDTTKPGSIFLSDLNSSTLARRSVAH